MIQIHIPIKEHLAEFFRAKNGVYDEGAVRIDKNSDLGVTLYDLLRKRPPGVSPVDKGNLCIELSRNNEAGKSPLTYNFIDIKGAKILEKKIELMMWAEAHEFIDFQKHREGIDIADAVYIFMRKFAITGVSPDCYLKNYQRWRERVRKKTKKRPYSSKKITFGS